jgi:16S rRNA (cytosine967-C5)-methyltransferase
MGLAPRPPKAGETTRLSAVELLGAILKQHQPFDAEFDKLVAEQRFEARDRAFVHALVATALRRKGEIDAIISGLLAKPLPRSAGPTELILLSGAAQLLFMDVPAHAAIDLAVTMAQRDPDARHFGKLINAILRRVKRDEGNTINTPAWLWERWQRTYGDATARAIAAAHLEEPPLDLSAKSDPAGWAERLGGALLPTGTIRLKTASRVETLPGYGEGAWWVQDAAARLPALLLGDVTGKRVLDLCAAPGGKTAQLAAAGAEVTALDRSPTRLARLKDNLARLKLAAEIIVADAATFEPDERFDAVLLDAPCAATGTIRRHPDLPYIKDKAQIAKLVSLQARLLAHAATLVGKGGTLVYCTCSLEPEEGEEQARRFLGERREFARGPIAPPELSGESQFINNDGDLRTHPAMTIGSGQGLDGFFAARFVRG